MVELVASPTEHRVESLSDFRDWTKRFPNVWTHLRFRGIAVKPNSKWALLCGQIRLQDSDVSTLEPFVTNEVCGFERIYPLSELSRLLEDIGVDGTVPTGRSPLPAREPLRIRDAEERPFRLAFGRSHHAGNVGWAHGSNRWTRYALEWKTSGNRRSLFRDHAVPHTWWDRAEEKLQARHTVRMSELAIRLEITDREDQMGGDYEPWIEVVAPLPLRIRDRRETSDRTRLRIELYVGRRIRSKDGLVRVVWGSERVEKPIPSPKSNGIILFERPRDAERAKVQVVYADEHIQDEVLELLPPLHANPRLLAVRHFERSVGLLESGLEPEAKNPNEHAFERSIAHFLTLIGFSVLWWGPDDNRMRDRLPMPKEQSDLLAFSADDQTVLVVECTVNVGKADKVVKLVQRARELEAHLKKDVSEIPPQVVPVFAIARPMPEVEPLAKTVGDGAVTFLTKDMLDATMGMLAKSCSYEEVKRSVPETLQCGFEALRSRELRPFGVFG